MLKTQGAMMESKVRSWCLQGERNSNYFYRLERSIHVTKHITELKLLDKTTLAKPKDISDEEYCFYKEFYTFTSVNPDDQLFDAFSNNPVFPKISAD